MAEPRFAEDRVYVEKNEAVIKEVVQADTIYYL